jgi:immune inhibitor A
VTAKIWYDIEAGYDYLYAEYSTDDGDNWVQIGSPIDGSSNGRFARVRYTIPGGDPDTLFRFRYQTDGGVHLPGAFIDDIRITKGRTELVFDDVEGAPMWIAEGGFKISTGIESVIGDRYYLAENRTYVGYDENLATGPYQFSFALTDPDKVEHFVQQDGLLIWMVDETYGDNNNSQHPGRGLALPVDAHPQPFTYGDGTRPSNRRQPFDATFGTQAVPAGPNADPEDPENPDPFGCGGLHKQIVVGHGPSQSLDYLCAWPGLHDGEGTLAAVTDFNDTNVDAYWVASNPQNSTKVAGHGVQMHVDSQTTNGPIVIDVTNPAAP